MSATEKHAGEIVGYHISLLESSGDYILALTSFRKVINTEYDTYMNIEFKPDMMYNELPAAEYKELKRDEAITLITQQLKDYTDTDAFKRSFLSHAKSISTDFSGMVWTR